MAVSPTTWSGHNINKTDWTLTVNTLLKCFKGSEVPTWTEDTERHELGNGEQLLCSSTALGRHRWNDEALRSPTTVLADGDEQPVPPPLTTTVPVTWGSESSYDNRSTFRPKSNKFNSANCRDPIVSNVSASTLMTGSSSEITADNYSCHPMTSTSPCLTRPTRTGLCLLLSPLWNTLFKGFEFSRRRRFRFPNMYIHVTTLVLIVSIVLRAAEACSSRSTPKPRPPSPTMRPNITFPTYACPPAYATWYCLNGATCFTVEISESILYNCVCAEGYTGPRCEFKDLDGSYLPSRDKIQVEKASIASGVTIAVVLMFIISIVAYIYTRRRKKEKHCDQIDSSNLTPRPFTTLRSQSLQRQSGHQRASTSQTHSHPDVEAGSNIQRESSSSSVHSYSSPPHLQVYNGFSIASRGSQL